VFMKSSFVSCAAEGAKGMERDSAGRREALEEIVKLFSNGRILKAYEEYERLSKEGGDQTQVSAPHLHL
jgi:hypothetical protein